MEASILPKRLESQATELEGQPRIRGWERLDEELGIDLERMARETKALQRKRGISSARDLLRLILFYASSNWSLRLVGAWALLNGIGYLSDVAILKRLRNSRHWIGTIIVRLMQKRADSLKKKPGVRLRVVDVTTFSVPGSKGIDWRLF